MKCGISKSLQLNLANFDLKSILESLGSKSVMQFSEKKSVWNLFTIITDKKEKNNEKMIKEESAEFSYLWNITILGTQIQSKIIKRRVYEERLFLR